ncbi:MAG TPA: hypothetical protein VHV57_17280 [Acidimicrobiales bacterium]|nr:hypothetical protein [Acidimicrobiales bacterium]
MSSWLITSPVLPVALATGRLTVLHAVWLLRHPVPELTLLALVSVLGLGRRVYRQRRRSRSTSTPGSSS